MTEIFDSAEDVPQEYLISALDSALKRITELEEKLEKAEEQLADRGMYFDRMAAEVGVAEEKRTKLYEVLEAALTLAEAEVLLLKGGLTVMAMANFNDQDDGYTKQDYIRDMLLEAKKHLESNALKAQEKDADTNIERIRNGTKVWIQQEKSDGQEA